MDALRAPSEHLYALLLLAYPRAFRQEYAAEMRLAFRDAYRDALRARGTIGVLGLWGELFADFVTSVCRQHAHRWLNRDARRLASSGREQLSIAFPFTLQVAQRTDTGLTRARNEDHLITRVPEDDALAQRRGALFVVADGMGARGDVASELVTRQVTDTYFQNRDDDLPTALRNAVEQASKAIYQFNAMERGRGTDGPEMGATCVAAVLHERLLYVANVGDSRAYVLHADQLRQVTRDHSLVAQLVERGELTPAEARVHPQRNLIYRSLGQPNPEVDLFIEPIAEGDTLILCTDGLCGVVGDEELRAVIEQYSPEESVQHLIARANARGGPDNITAIVVRVSALS